MRHNKVVATIALLVLCSFPVHSLRADPLDLSLVEHDSKSQLTIGLELAKVAIGSQSLSGGGLRFGYEYGISDKWSILPAVSLVFSAGGSGYLYSSIEGSFRYSLTGSLKSTQREINNHGTPIISEKEAQTNRFSLSLGFEQLFLNGATTVYPAAGIAAGVAYSFQFLHHWSEVSLRDAQMSAGSKSSSAIFLDFSFLFNGM